MQFVRSITTSRRALASYACSKPSNLYIVRHGARLDQLEPKWREEAKSLGENVYLSTLLGIMLLSVSSFLLPVAMERLRSESALRLSYTCSYRTQNRRKLYMSLCTTSLYLIFSF